MIAEEMYFLQGHNYQELVCKENFSWVVDETIGGS